MINSVNKTSNIEALGFTQGAHTIDTNFSEGGVMFGSLNVTENITIADTICFNTDCSARIFFDGSRLIGVG